MMLDSALTFFETSRGAKIDSGIGDIVHKV